MKYIYTLLLIGIIICPTRLFAQSTDISIDVVPLNPQPGQTVTLTTNSYGSDLTQATITWSYNNTVIAQGTGKTSVTVIAPAAGAAGVLTVTATGAGIQGASATIVLRPASVDLLWEAVDAYTPPFYKGKALLPVGGLIRVTAIPAASTPRSLSYAWSRSNSALQDESGFAKSSILFRHDALNPQEKIDVNIRSGTFDGTGMVRVTPHDPVVVAYQNKEGFIDYPNGYNSTIALHTPGVVLHVEPYYFSVPRSLATDLSIDTTIDGQAVSPSQPNEIGLSRPDNGGQSSLRLAITTVVYSLQHLEKTFTLLFN